MNQTKAVFSISEIEPNIVQVDFDTPNVGVNAFNAAAFASLASVLDELEQRDDIKGCVFTSSKNVFCVGADIPVLLQSAKDGNIEAMIREGHDVFSRVQSLPFATVAAINGFALGGGLEFTLAMDARVASEQASVGLPEVNLGVFPGWGGTTRLPRIIAPEIAAQWVATGRHQKATSAQASGLVSQVVNPDELLAASVKLVQELASDYADIRVRKSAGIEVSADAQQQLKQLQASLAKRPGPFYPAGAAAVTSMLKQFALPLDDANKVEIADFVTLAQTDTAINLLSVFINEQAATKAAKKYAKQGGDDVQSSAVLGAGIMGGGIAYQSALRNIPVVMKDIFQEALDLGMQEADQNFSVLVKKGKITDDDKSEGLARIKPTLDNADLAGVDVVVEAVVENTAIKKAVLSELEDHVDTDTIIVSNTSTISITRLAEDLKRPENFAGMHFFNPVPVMPLVEVIRGEKSSDKTIANTVNYALQLGKMPVVVNDCPAFFVNRVLFPYINAAHLLIEQGIDFQQIDRVMEAWGWPMGPAYLSDVVGIDTMCHCLDVLANDIPERMTLDFDSANHLLHAKERFGQKNGLGFYKYEKNDKGRTVKVVDQDAYGLIYSGDTKEIDATEIEQRLMSAICLEAVRCVQEGIVASPAEADMALLWGIGFPRFRGGVLRHIDTIGVEAFCQQVEAFENDSPMYQLPELLLEMRKQNKSFY